MGRRIELNSSQSLDEHPNHIFVLRFKRSKNPLPDGFYHDAFTRIVLGENLKIHPEDLQHVIPQGLNLLDNKRQWAEVHPKRPVRLINAEDKDQKPVALIWT